MSRRGHFDSGHGREDFSQGPLDPFDEDEYLMSFVECDNCGQDTHMDDALTVKPEQPKSVSGHVTNYYCGPTCRDLHQSGDRKGMIGNPFVQTGWDPKESFKKNK